MLLTSFTDLYSDDFVLPTGNLREPKNGAKRATFIVVTKCPENLSIQEKEKIKEKLNPNANQLVFFSSINYSKEVFSAKEELKLTNLKPFTLVTGIANPKPLIQYLKTHNLEFKHLNFKDHHNFSEKEIDELAQLECIVTTEKDYMRLKDETKLQDKLFYLPIEISIDREEAFIRQILNFVNA
jgi:tetraacyldisaccharide 4'-kinase